MALRLIKLCIYVIQLHFNHIIVTIETGELILYICLSHDLKVINVSMCNELGGNMARSTQFPIMISRSTIIYEIVSPGAAGSSIYI